MTDTIRLAAGSGPTFGVDDIACAAATTLGLWSDEGLDVTWTPVHGGVRAVEAVLDGTVDVAYGGLGPVIGARTRGAPVKVIVSMARGLAQNLVVRDGIDTPAGLRGASWALDGFGALSHHMARLVVRALDIPEAEIDWRAVGPPPERIEQLLAGDVDCSLIRVEEAESLGASHADVVHTLLGFADLKALVPVQPHGVLSTTEALIATRPDTLRRLVRGMIRASRALHDDYDTFRRVYDRHVTVPLANDRVHAIWRQEHDTGGFAVNGALGNAHWTSQLALYRALNPDGPAAELGDVIATEFAEAALDGLGRHLTAFDPPPG